CWWEPVPFGAKHVLFEAKPTPSKLPGPLMLAFSTPGNELYTRTRRRPPVPAAPESIESPEVPRPPQTPAASFKRPNRKCPGPNLPAILGLHSPGHFRLGHSVSGQCTRSPLSGVWWCEGDLSPLSADA